MTTPRRVVWTDGMLMSPHHLQLMDAYHDGARALSVSAVTPFAWGLTELLISAEALEGGSVLLQRVSGLLPSGTFLDIRADSPECPPARVVGSLFPPHQEALGVYLGVPLSRDGAANLSASQDARTRFRTVSADAFDFAEGGNPRSIDQAVPRAQLLLGDESRDDFESIKVAELVRDASNSLQLSPSYVPPCLRTSASTYLASATEQLVAAMASKARELKEQVSIRDRTSVEYNSADITHFLLLDALNTMLPLVRHAAEAKELSNHALYLLLVQLAGKLCSFVSGGDALGLPVYVHHDPSQTFVPLFSEISRMLRASVANRHIAVALRGREDGTHLGQLSDPALQAQGVQFVLAVEGPLPEEQVASVVSGLGKLGSWGDIQQLVSTATAGIPLKTRRAPKEIPIRPNHVYFDIGTNTVYWQNVLRERRVALYLPPPLQGPAVKVTLYGIP